MRVAKIRTRKLPPAVNISCQNKIPSTSDNRRCRARAPARLTFARFMEDYRPINSELRCAIWLLIGETLWDVVRPAANWRSFVDNCLMPASSYKHE